MSYNFGMVALNYFQRFLSVLFVDPKVFKASTAKLNPLNAKMSEEDYTFNTATGLITFTVTTNHDNLIVKLSKII